nr:MAG TPA: hypothetical protein [Caudoviricetes sp.]
MYVEYEWERLVGNRLALIAAISAYCFVISSYFLTSPFCLACVFCDASALSLRTISTWEAVLALKVLEAVMIGPFCRDIDLFNVDDLIIT